MAEYTRLDKGGKYNYHFISDLLENKISMEIVKGDAI
jgi:hypothetical protein